MIATIGSLVVAAAVRAPGGSDDAPVRPTLEEIFRPPRLLGVEPRELSVSADGRFALWRWSETDAEEPELGWWIAPCDGSEAARELFPAKPPVELQWAPRGAELLLTRDGWLERFDPASGATTPLFECGERRSRVTFTRDGEIALFTAGADSELWALEWSSGLRWSPARTLSDRGGWFALLEELGEVALFAAPPGEPAPARQAAPASAETGGRGGRDGSRERGREEPRAAAGEESREGEKRPRVLWRVPLTAVGGAPRATALQESGRTELSADGRYALQTTRVQDARRQLILADYLAEQVTAVPVRGDLAGDPPPRTALALRDVATGEERALPIDEGERFVLIDATFAPTGARLLVQRISADSKVRQILLVDPDAGSSRLLFAERDAAWIGGPLLHASWRGDGSALLFSSEQDGFARLWLAGLDASPPRAISPAGSEVLRVRVDPEAGVALALSNLRDPAERSLLRLDLATGEARELATPRGGCVGSFAASRDGSRVAFLFERLGAPADVHALATAGEAAAVRLSDLAPPALRELALPPPEVVSLRNESDGTPLRALFYAPATPPPAGRLAPAVLFVHGAGYLQNVTRSMTEYPQNYLFHQRLSRLGYAVLDVDYRHSAGYGRKFRTDIHGHMGGKDLDDLLAGVAWLAARGDVDRARIGLYGGSYGGFLTLMALFTQPEVFACGAALRSVTDWRTYNTWYTTPRLGDPGRDAENYRRSSPIDHAEGLARPLLLLHGLKDSNVFAQDSIRLIEKLIQLGKEFDAMLYPSQEHAFTDPESWIDEYRRIERLFERELRGR